MSHTGWSAFKAAVVGPDGKVVAAEKCYCGAPSCTGVLGRGRKGKRAYAVDAPMALIPPESSTESSPSPAQSSRALPDTDVDTASVSSGDSVRASRRRMRVVPLRYADQDALDALHAEAAVIGTSTPPLRGSGRGRGRGRGLSLIHI